MDQCKYDCAVGWNVLVPVTCITIQKPRQGKVHDTCSRNWCQKINIHFWYRILVRVSCKSLIFWYQIPAPINTVLLYARKWCASDWYHDLWLVDDNCWRFNVLWSCCMQCYDLFIYLIFSAMFIFGTRNFHSKGTWNKKPPPKMQVDLWLWILEHVLVIPVSLSENV